MRKSRRSKAKDVRTHFEKRCLQRLGYLPNHKELVRKIQSNELEFFERQSGRVTKWKWTDPVSKENFILTYDKERKQIITVMFENFHEYIYVGDKKECGEEEIIQELET